MRIKTRSQLTRHLYGKGIEIGALHQPLDISSSKISRIQYVDRMSVKNLRNHYPDLKNFKLVNVDILDDATTLKTIPDESLDFIIANHLIEHIANPILALENWYKKLKVGGILYMAVPDMRKTFDKKRTLTSIEHIVNDYEVSEKELKKRNISHFYEWSRLVNGTTEKNVEKEVKNLIKIDYSIHYHTFIFESMLKFLKYLRERLGIHYKVIDYSHTHPEGIEFIFILKKVKPKVNILSFAFLLSLFKDKYFR